MWWYWKRAWKSGARLRWRSPPMVSITRSNGTWAWLKASRVVPRARWAMDSRVSSGPVDSRTTSVLRKTPSSGAEGAQPRSAIGIPIRISSSFPFRERNAAQRDRATMKGVHRSSRAVAGDLVHQPGLDLEAVANRRHPIGGAIVAGVPQPREWFLQRPAPVLDPGVEATGPLHLALAGDVVDELGLELGKVGLDTGDGGGVRRAQLVAQQAQRPAVGRDVVLSEIQQVPVRLELDEREPDGRLGREVEGPAPDRLDVVGGGGVRIGCARGRQHLERQGVGRAHHQARFTPLEHDPRPEDVVTSEHGLDRRCHGGRVEGALQLEDAIDEIGLRVRAHPGLEPHGLLQERQR